MSMSFSSFSWRFLCCSSNILFLFCSFLYTTHAALHSLPHTSTSNSLHVDLFSCSAHILSYQPSALLMAFGVYPCSFPSPTSSSLDVFFVAIALFIVVHFPFDPLFCLFSLSWIKISLLHILFCSCHVYSIQLTVVLCHFFKYHCTCLDYLSLICPSMFVLLIWHLT